MPSSSASFPAYPEINKDITFCGITLNHNVFWTLIMCSAYGVADNVWSGTVFAAYLKLIFGDSNSAVGYVEASNGLAGLFTALPIGWLADKYKRSAICKWGSLTLVFSAVFHSAILYYVGDDIPEGAKENTSMYLFLAVMFLWGASGGVVNGPLQALYADSTPAGERSEYYVYLFASYMLSSMAGPLISIVLFQYWGDEWELKDLKNIILVGMGLEIFAAIFLCKVDDRYALKERGEEEKEEKKKKEEEGGEEEKKRREERKTPLQRRQRYIPWILFIVDLLVALGSGMTVKFFPLFFKDDAKLSPTQVQLIYLAVPVIIVLISKGAQVLSASLGRVQTILLVKFFGLSFLFALCFYTSYLIERPALLITIYLARTGLMNCTYPLQESILMDFVPKNERARWKSLESVGAFGWCGSAALGGYLADKYDYPFTFLITAIIQTTGAAGYMLLLPLVPRKEKDMKEDELEEPLLRRQEGEREEGSLPEVV